MTARSSPTLQTLTLLTLANTLHSSGRNDTKEHASAAIDHMISTRLLLPAHKHFLLDQLAKLREIHQFEFFKRWWAQERDEREEKLMRLQNATFRFGFLSMEDILERKRMKGEVDVAAFAAQYYGSVVQRLKESYVGDS